MLTEQRKQLLLERLKSDGQLVAKTLSEQLGLSEDTIRRDLRELAKAGLLERVHGGALPCAQPHLPASPALGDFAQRLQIAPEAKSQIGRAAAALVQPGQVVFIDGGTTALQLVRHLPPSLHATVVTHSPTIAVALVEHPHIDVILLGGRLFKHSVVAVGATTLQAIAQIHADLYFMGVCSLHPDTGASTGDYEEASVKRALNAAARATVVLASPEKLETAAPFHIVDMAAITQVIVESGTPEELLARYRASGVEVMIA